MALALSGHAAVFSNTDPYYDELLYLAKLELAFQGPVAPLQFQPTTIAGLREILCPKKKCQVNAVYVSGKIYYIEDLDSEDFIDLSIMYHEIVHHVQSSKYGPTINCKIWRYKELEARKLQYKFLQSKDKNQSPYFRHRFNKLNCPI